MGDILIVYAHRVQQLLKQGVVELGMTLELTDEASRISLKQNEQVFRQAAASLGINCECVEEGGRARLVFHPK